MSYEQKIRDIFKHPRAKVRVGKGGKTEEGTVETSLVRDYEECTNSRCISFVLQVPANVATDLPKQLDQLAELLNDQKVTAMFAGHGSKLDVGQTLYVRLLADESMGLRKGEVLSEIQMPTMKRFNLRDHIEGARKRVGHRHVQAKLLSSRNSVYMLINANSQDAKPVKPETAAPAASAAEPAADPAADKESSK